MSGLDDTILCLHRLARDCAPGEFQKEAILTLRGILQFDTATWGTMRLDGSGFEALATYLFEEPDSLLASYQNIRRHDLMGARALAHPGEPQIFHEWDTRTWESFSDEFRAHCEAFSVKNLLSIVHKSIAARYYAFMTLNRRNLSSPFSEEDKAFVRLLLPHLMSAWASHIASHSVQLTRAAVSLGELKGYFTASGRTLASSPAFNDALNRELASWDGLALPETILDVLRRGGEWVGRSVSVAGAPVDDVWVLHACPKASTRELTARELAVAHYASEGLTYKAIARELKLSPATIRNHLHSAYRKLNVSNKTALSRRIGSHA